jgi:hypothetical protein
MSDDFEIYLDEPNFATRRSERIAKTRALLSDRLAGGYLTYWAITEEQMFDDDGRPYIIIAGMIDHPKIDLSEQLRLRIGSPGVAFHRLIESNPPMNLPEGWIGED